MKKLSIGFDIGSVSINTIICDSSAQVIEEWKYCRHFGKTLQLCSDILEQIEQKYCSDTIERVVFTGAHGKALATALNTYYEVETIAQASGVHNIFPETKSIISVGGHDSALFLLDYDDNQDFTLTEFKLNEACAAGTGSFIDQQAERIFFQSLNEAPEGSQSRIESILSQFINEGLKSDSPANVACRCTVFTKSDMIHLQNKGIPISHIIAGLHEGVARNFKSTLINDRKLQTPIVFIGGYATNKLAHKAFEKILGYEITIPKYHTSIGALGVTVNAIKKQAGKSVTSCEISSLQASDIYKAPRTHPLTLKLSVFTDCQNPLPIKIREKRIGVFMGFDVGSTTTKLVLIRPNGEVIFKTYIPTEGQPLEAIKKAMKNCIATLEVKKLTVIGVGTTGSGREVAGLFVGGDDVVNEVTAHAMGTSFYDPKVDTIFELGGQDAKYTYLEHGRIADFKMNKVCAAGTGSFLEETANKLGINIVKEYEDLAMNAKNPYKLTERCTVYMESDLMSYLQNGAKIDDLLAGLSQAVVHNYLNRVVQDGKIGTRISFQGGPSLNKSVVASFEKILGKTIITLPNREVMGAIGAALHAQKKIENLITKNIEFKTNFRGWQTVNESFFHREEVCTRNRDCHNKCKLQIYEIGNETAIFGGECGLYETQKKVEKKAPDFTKIRNLIYAKYFPKTDKQSKIKIKIGIPRALTYHQSGLLWATMFNKLGFEIVISPETDNSLANLGINSMTCEACFPVKIAHGHTLYLKDKCDFMFLPLMIEMEETEDKYAFYCPYVEASTYMLKSALKLDPKRIIKPAVYMKKGIEAVVSSISSEFTRLGIKVSAEKLRAAYEEGAQTLNSFNSELRKVGSEVLAKIGTEKAIIVLGRPYSAFDSRTNLNLFASLSRLGIYAIPQSFLSFDKCEINSKYPNMYWGFGNSILKASQFLKDNPNLYALYLTSFSCGPDSFILHFFNEEMSESNKPFLELELDEHSAGAGVETRLLAFIDTINNHVPQNEQKAAVINETNVCNDLRKRTLYLPDMAAGARCLAACFRNIGIKAEVMPTYSSDGLEFGKQNTSGKECFPCIVTTGDMLDFIDKSLAKDIDVENEIAFFMPETEGPCRFGQYNKLQRMILDKHGFSKIPILSPTSEDSYSFNGQISAEETLNFRKLIWQAIVYSDLIEKALWKTRPYEKIKGTANEVFDIAMDLGVNAIEKGGGLEIIRAARKAARLFSKIDLKKEKKPLIGIVGEIFVRTHKESNQNLVIELEELGCEAQVASVCEWIAYTTHTGIEESLKAFKDDKKLKNLLNVANFWTASKYQSLMYKMIALPFRKLLKNRLDHETKEILELANNNFSNHINGEAILSIGGALAFTKSGFDGVVNAMPFTCMPSTIASSILKTEMRNKIPYIDMVYDGSIQPNRSMNLETFVFQAKQRMIRKEQLSAKNSKSDV